MATAVWKRLQSKVGLGGLAIGAIILAALVFIGVSVVRDMKPATVNTAKGSRFSCTVLSVYDGDGPINCSELNEQGRRVSVRIRGIESREADDSCQASICPKASGAEAKAELTRLAVGRLECESYGPSYNRVDAFCRNASGQDLSCEMVRSGTAVRWAQYDPEGRLLGCASKQR